jgi:hypothetical protein
LSNPIKLPEVIILVFFLELLNILLMRFIVVLSNPLSIIPAIITVTTPFHIINDE